MLQFAAATQAKVRAFRGHALIGLLEDINRIRHFVTRLNAVGAKADFFLRQRTINKNGFAV